MSTATKARPQGLSKTIRYFYGIGDMCFALMTSVGQYYQAFYLTNVAKLSLVSVGLLTSTVALVDALTSWIFGAVINSTKPMRWGRYRSWLVAFTWGIPIFYFFQFVRIGNTEAVAVMMYFITMLGCKFFHNWPYVANVSLVNVVAKSPDERIIMASSRATWNNASKFAWSYLGVPFLAILNLKFGEKYGYAVLSCLLSILTVIAFYGHFKMTEGYEDTGAEETANAAKAVRARTKPKDLLKGLIANPPLLCLILADTAKWLFNFIVAGTVVYYFTYIALNRGMQATYTLIIAFCSVIGAWASRRIGKLISGRVTMIIAYLLMAAALLVARMFYTNPWTVVILVSVAQLAYGCSYACSTALYGDSCIYNEWKTGKNASGWIMGLTNIPLKVAAYLKTWLLPICLAVGGFSASVAPEEATVAMKEGICLALMVVPACLLIFGALVMLFGFRLPKSRLEEMQKEIEERKAAEEAAA